jgi:hypothetical protein
MDLKTYLLNCFLEDRSVIEELLFIDNKVQYTNLTYEKLLDVLKNISVYDNLDEAFSYIAITDGEFDSVCKILINITEIKTLYVNRCFLGINKYIVKCVNEFYGADKVMLDSSVNYQKYIDKSNKIVLCGFDTFVEELTKEFNECEIIIL